MRKVNHLAQKQVLWGLIKRLGTIYGEDPGYPTTEYAKDVYEANLEDLEGAIGCFQGLVSQAERLGRVKSGRNER